MLSREAYSKTNNHLSKPYSSYAVMIWNKWKFQRLFCCFKVHYDMVPKTWTPVFPHVCLWPSWSQVTLSWNGLVNCLSKHCISLMLSTLFSHEQYVFLFSVWIIPIWLILYLLFNAYEPAVRCESRGGKVMGAWQSMLCLQHHCHT